MAETPHPYLADLERLHADLDRLAERDPVFLPVTTKRQALLLMASASSRAQAVLARLVACADDVADADGHRDVASWLTHRTHDSLATSRRAQRLGAACEQRWHRVGLGLLGGRMTVDQAQVIVAALDELACGRDLVDAPAKEWAEVLVRAEAHLVAQAADFGPRELRRLGERLLEVIAPRWAEELERRQLDAAERAARRRTTLGVRHLGDGTALVKARVPEAVALRLTTMLESFTNPRKENGEAVAADGDGRRLPYERRLGKAFCSLMEALDPARLPLHGGPRRWSSPWTSRR